MFISLYSIPGVSVLGPSLVPLTFLSCTSERVSHMSHHNADCSKRVPVMEKHPGRFLRLDTSPSPPRFNYMSEKPHSLSGGVQTLLFKESSYRRAESLVVEVWCAGRTWWRVTPQDWTRGFKMILFYYIITSCPLHDPDIVFLMSLKELLFALWPHW